MAVSFDQARELLSAKPVRYSAGGIVAVAGMAMTFALGPSRAHAPVLAAAAELPPGTVLTAADLKSVDTMFPSTDAISTGQEKSLLGQTLRFGLPEGALLTPGDTGEFPPDGYVKASLLVRPGQYPQDLVAGQKVGIVPLSADGMGSPAALQADGAPAGALGQGAASSAAATGANVVTGELLSMSPVEDSQGGMVAELMVPASQAAQVVAVPSAALLGMSGAGL